MQNFLKIVALAACVTLIAGTSLAANGQFAAGGNLGYYTLSGDDFEAVDAGFGGNGFVRYNMENNFGINTQLSWNQHGIEGADDNVNVLSIGVEPRYNFKLSNPQFSPYLGAKAAWVRNSGYQMPDENLELQDASASGWGFGAVAGVVMNINEQWGIEVGANWNAISFGDIDVNGTSAEGTDSSGNALNFTTGVVFNFPK